MKLVCRAISVFTAIVALICGMLWNARRGIPYNEQGRFFDEVNSVVLHEQSVTIYGFLTLVLGSIAAAAWILAGQRRS